MTVGWILPAVLLEFNELDLLRSQTHGECLEAGAFDAEQVRETWVILAPPLDGLEAEGVAVELLGPGQVGNRYTDAIDFDHLRRRRERQLQERNQNSRERRTDAPWASSRPDQDHDVQGPSFRASVGDRWHEGVLGLSRIETTTPSESTFTRDLAWPEDCSCVLKGLRANIQIARKINAIHGTFLIGSSCFGMCIHVP